jgi:hypothetical protein
VNNADKIFFIPLAQQSANLLVVVSFARHGRSRPQSFPRKRKSTPQTFGNALSTDWIPAFAGMTGVSYGMIFQMTPLRTFCKGAVRNLTTDEVRTNEHNCGAVVPSQ